MHIRALHPFVGRLRHGKHAMRAILRRTSVAIRRHERKAPSVLLANVASPSTGGFRILQTPQPFATLPTFVFPTVFTQFTRSFEVVNAHRPIPLPPCLHRRFPRHAHPVPPGTGGGAPRDWICPLQRSRHPAQASQGVLRAASRILRGLE